MHVGTSPTTRRWLRALRLVGFYWLMGLLYTLIAYGSIFGLLRLMFKPMGGPNLAALLALFWVAPIGSTLGWASSRLLTRIVRGFHGLKGGAGVFVSVLAGVLVLPIDVLSGIVENYLVGNGVSQAFGSVLFACINATLVGLVMVIVDKVGPVDELPQ